MTDKKQKELVLVCRRIFDQTKLFDQQSLSTFLGHICPLVQYFKSDPVINFKDEVTSFNYTEIYPNRKTLKRVVDLASLTKYMRDATSHPELDLDFDDDNSVTIKFCAVIGEGVFVVLTNRKLESKYNDDIAYFHGKGTIYHHRHLGRVLRAIEARLGFLNGY
jgi:hypothetical protein